MNDNSQDNVHHKERKRNENRELKGNEHRELTGNNNHTYEHLRIREMRARKAPVTRNTLGRDSRGMLETTPSKRGTET